MKKLILIISMIPVLVLAQTQTENYIKSTTYKGAGATLPVMQVTYFDGLGRPIQQIANAQSHTEKDIVTHIEYDAFGRQVKDYLPFISSTAPSLNIKSNEVTSFYGSNNVALTGDPKFETTTNPYSEKLLENSPLNRVFKQAAPGAAWALGSGHEIKLEYQTNTATEEVKYFKATATWNTGLGLYDIAITNPSDYPANTLYKMVTKDENWTNGDNNTTQEFKNKEGQVVLKRTFDNGAHDTYYVYDQYGNLTYVLPPLAEGAITQTVLDGLCYQYKYDYRNRLAAKKIPGKQWEYVVYDKLDKPVATGPTFSPFGGTTEGWLITKYDVFGRVAYTGWYDLVPCTEAGRKSMNDQQHIDIHHETSMEITIDGIPTGYTSKIFPTTGYKLLTINYYDNYTYPNAPPLPTTLPNSAYPIAQNVKGLSTGSWVRVLTLPSETNGERSCIFYDDKYRPVRTHTTNYLGGFTQVDTNLDFIGKTNYTVTTHKRVDADEAITIKDSFTYSAQDRLLLHKQQINEMPEELIASNTYNELGQLTSKNVGGTDTTGALGLQKVDYNYNIRGWLKGINDTANLNQGVAVPQDLFAFKLNYNDPATATALYNGNISETFWKTKNDNVLRKYGYTYDNLNRLLSAAYQKPESTVVNTNSYNESLNYDKNGNITHLTRTGEYDDASYPLTIDDLAYNYAPNSNQLLKVFDSTNNPKGFQDDTQGITDPVDDYTYDDNGNMKTDDNKKITSITYNHLNLPTKIVFNNSEDNKIEYLYNAIGQKLRKIVTQMVCRSWRGTVTCELTVGKTEYLSGFQYVNDVLDYFPQPEGYVKVFQEDIMYFFYVYNYTDHLGNVRLSYGLDPGTTTLKIFEENNYYPFGLKHNNYNVSKKHYTMNGLATTIANCNGCYEGYNYKFNGKELQDELGLNMYDYGARNYDPAIGRWMNVDPLAENYLAFSPYVYVANNPIRYIDPNGMEIKDPDKVVDAYKKQLNHNVSSISEFVKNGAISSELGEKFIKVNQTALDEITSLEKSDQVYSVYSDKNNSEGGVSYDSASNEVSIGVGTVNNEMYGVTSHEMKHAYQFEKGKTSLVTDNSSFGSLYDVGDETEAYNRERVINTGATATPKIWTNSDVLNHGKGMIPPAYQNLPSGPIDINSKEGKALRNRTIEAGRNGQAVQEVYKGWQKDYAKGAKK
jgi:RHS repeat-associated protein